jgi:ribonuclease Y
MENPILLAALGGAIGLISLISGFIFGKKSVSADVTKLEEDSKKEALRIVENAKKEAENIKKNQVIEAKEEKLKLSAEFERSTRDRESKLIQK